MGHPAILPSVEDGKPRPPDYERELLLRLPLDRRVLDLRPLVLRARVLELFFELDRLERDVDFLPLLLRAELFLPLLLRAELFLPLLFRAELFLPLLFRAELFLLLVLRPELPLLRLELLRALDFFAVLEPPLRPPLRAGALFVFLPRPEPLFLPPPDILFTVAHARCSASFLPTPRFS
ncbi:MAG TPA: hypothetical protein VFC24_10865 [Casimicrobiaceae bacterium]|nr:hypothetical protein [Casimicrobiaceae bacterium]